MAFVRADMVSSRVKATQPLVERTLDAGTLTLLVGPRGTGKTYVALSLAAHLAYGAPWLGDRHVYETLDRYTIIDTAESWSAYVDQSDALGYADTLDGWNAYTNDHPRTYTDADGVTHHYTLVDDMVCYSPPGSTSGYIYGVGYVAAEAPGGTEARLAALGIRQESYSNAVEAHPKTRRGEKLDMWDKRELLTGGSPLIDTTAVDLTNDDAVDDHIKDLHDADVHFVVYDTLAKCLGGQSDNDPGVMSTAVASLDRIARETRLGILAIHHTGKDGKTIRGSSHLESAADTIWMTRGNPEQRATLHCVKRRNGRLEMFTDVSFRLRQVDGNAVVEHASGKASDVRAGKVSKMSDADDIARVIREAENDAERELSKPERVAVLMSELGMKRATAYRKVPASHETVSAETA